MKDLTKKLLKKIENEQLKRGKIEELGDRMKEPNLIAVSDALDEFYFLDKLKIYCAYLSYTKIINPATLSYQQSDFRLIDAILEQIESRPVENVLLHIYNNIRLLYQTIETPSPAADLQYKILFQLVKTNSGSFPVKETEDLFSFLSNYCIRRMNNGAVTYRENLFLVSNELLKLRFGKRGKKKNTLPSAMLKNMVVTALLLKDSPVFKSIKTEGLVPENPEQGFKDVFEWIAVFLNVYGPRMEKKNRDLYLSYSWGLLEFEKKNYIKACQILQDRIGSRGMFMNLNLKMLYLKVLYEIHNTMPVYLEKNNISIEKALEAYRGLIRDEINRKKDLAYQVEFYVVFEKYFRKVYRFHFKYSGILFNNKNQEFLQKKEVLHLEIEEIKYPCRSWLLEKIQAIK